MIKNFTPFYVWPVENIPFRHYYHDESLDIFIIENVVHNYKWLDINKNKIKDRHFFFVYCGWYMDYFHAKKYDEMFDYLGLKKENFFFMFNSKKEEEFILERGFKGKIINHNCWLDEKIMASNPDVQKKYDAIMVARKRPFKRHHLAAKVPNLALVSNGGYVKNDEKLIIPDHVYDNDRVLDPGEVFQKMNESRCGLILSELEGACFTSSEYLLCGIPVVSTKSLGGRDLWYNEYNSIVCEPNEDAVAEAVEFFKSNQRNPLRIREEHIRMSESQRNEFIDVLQEVFDKYGSNVDAKEYFKKNFYHKMRKHININNIEFR
jgi:glycosyltransferase involved in cell wall biosynthesis